MIKKRRLTEREKETDIIFRVSKWVIEFRIRDSSLTSISNVAPPHPLPVLVNLYFIIMLEIRNRPCNSLPLFIATLIITYISNECPSLYLNVRRCICRIISSIAIIEHHYFSMHLGYID